jgi:hypothetical protein
VVAGLRPVYRAVTERDGSWWAIRVPELRGVYLQARRLADRVDAERAARRASEQLRAAVDRLVSAGLTVRDIAHLLGLSHQRVAQVAGRPHRSAGKR